MSATLVTVDHAAKALNLHPRTVLRYIREGQLAATRIGKSYRIRQSDLDTFAGIAAGAAAPDARARATCIVDVADLTADEAQRLASFLHSAALAGDAGTPPLHIETAYDPAARDMKIVFIGSPADTGKLLEMLHLNLRGR